MNRELADKQFERLVAVERKAAPPVKRVDTRFEWNYRPPDSPGRYVVTDIYGELRTAIFDGDGERWLKAVRAHLPKLEPARCLKK